MRNQPSWLAYRSTNCHFDLFIHVLLSAFVAGGGGFVRGEAQETSS
jgi:hypothetical protein